MAKKPPNKAQAFAGLGALRAQLPAGPAPRAWLVATRDGAPCGWLPVAGYRQTISSPLFNPTLAIPGLLAKLCVIENDHGEVVLEVIDFQIKARAPDGSVREQISGAASVNVEGEDLLAVGATRTLDPTSTVTLRADGVVALRLQAHEPASPQQPRATKQAPPVRPKGADLIVRGGTRKVIDAPTAPGWLHLAGASELVCDGRLACLGIVLETGATLRCGELVANFVSVAHRGEIVTERIRARVVHVEELALEELIRKGAVTADYLQHDGRDLNPSFDYVRGELGLLPGFYERGRDPDAPVQLAETAIRDALFAGEAVFTDSELLVRTR